jgi:hypothetical protein
MRSSEGKYSWEFQAKAAAVIQKTFPELHFFLGSATLTPSLSSNCVRRFTP